MYWVEIHCDRKRAPDCVDDCDAPGMAGSASAARAADRAREAATAAGWRFGKVLDPKYGPKRNGWMCPACQKEPA